MVSLHTNTTSIMVQKNLAKATQGINTAMQQLTTGYKIISAKDDPANYAIMKSMEAKLNSWSVAQDNISIGYDMLETASSSAELIYKHISRIRSLCEQACNGTYGDASVNAIKGEIEGRLEEIQRIRKSTEFNGISIFGTEKGDGEIEAKTINIQVGIDSSESSKVSIDTTLRLNGLKDFESMDITNPETLDKIDEIMSELTTYQTKIGASQNRLEYSLDYVDVMTKNLTSSLSTIRDADIAKASSDLIRYQILQQACATLLATANQMPAIALQLL